MNSVEADVIVVKLNTPAPSAEAHAKFVSDIQAQTVSLDNDWQGYLEAELAARLRGYVDEWLVTGIMENGSERPHQRALGRAPEALLAVTSYLERYPARVDLMPDSHELSVYLAEVSALPGPSGNPYFDVGVDATRLFVGLMASDWRWRLCKCHHCGRYFLHPKPRQVYRKGTFCCRQHQSHTTAVQRTRARRLRAKSQLVDFAAAQLVKWNVTGQEWKDDHARKVRLAKQISQHIWKSKDPNLTAEYPLVQVEWVTRNRHPIEQKRRELA